ncbi:DUF2971 domain-containing protein [Pseudomonas sp. VB3]|uniref:DUF2971 domain-containing protein n=1 Tax=Pseudomonas sp. VB3 TaxID=2994641 RepID=UPI0022EC6267|nr:DUF2971 domain-containing protein [Pseudomonas sp. VB3]
MRLYKYLSPELTSVLENQMVRFSQPSSLNDPYELKPHISSLMSDEDMLTHFSQHLPSMIDDEYLKLDPHIKSVFPYGKFKKAMTKILKNSEPLMLNTITTNTPLFSEKLFETMDKFLGIFCLSEIPDNELMWSHYANAHQGFLLEFDSESLFFNQKRSSVDELLHLRQIQYSAQRPSITLNKITDFTPFLTKGTQWSYEREWRMMLPLAEASQIIEKENTKIHLFQFPHNAIKTITLGHRMTTARKAYIKDVINSINQFDHVKLYEAKIGTTDYSIFAEECSRT